MTFAELSFEQTIGNNVLIANGAKILGNITTADAVVIGVGANVVFVNDILEPNII